MATAPISGKQGFWMARCCYELRSPIHRSLLAKLANPIPIQSFPGEHPLEYYPGRTGAIANNVLNLPNRPMDAVYRLKFTFAHRGDNLVLVFSGKNLQALNDESWGIGSIEVRTGTVRVPNTATARNGRK